jgi:hypothetical protein
MRHKYVNWKWSNLKGCWYPNQMTKFLIHLSFIMPWLGASQCWAVIRIWYTDNSLITNRVYDNFGMLTMALKIYKKIEKEPAKEPFLLWPVLTWKPQVLEGYTKDQNHSLIPNFLHKNQNSQFFDSGFSSKDQNRWFFDPGIAERTRTDGYLKSQRTAQHSFTLILPAFWRRWLSFWERKREKKD